MLALNCSTQVHANTAATKLKNRAAEILSDGKLLALPMEIKTMISLMVLNLLRGMKDHALSGLGHLSCKTKSQDVSTTKQYNAGLMFF